jgi:hypothetical protein
VRRCVARRATSSGRHAAPLVVARPDAGRARGWRLEAEATHHEVGIALGVGHDGVAARPLTLAAQAERGHRSDFAYPWTARGSWRAAGIGAGADGAAQVPGLPSAPLRPGAVGVAVDSKASSALKNTTILFTAKDRPARGLQEGPEDARKCPPRSRNEG